MGFRLPSRRRSGPAGKAIDDAVAKAMAAFSMQRPVGERAMALAEGLKLTRAAIAATTDLDAKFILTIKEQQFQDAINSAMGMELTAIAQPAGQPEPTGPGAAFAPPAVMAAPVPGQTIRSAREASESRRHHGGCSAGCECGDHDRGR